MFASAVIIIGKIAESAYVRKYFLRTSVHMQHVQTLYLSIYLRRIYVPVLHSCTTYDEDATKCNQRYCTETFPCFKSFPCANLSKGNARRLTRPQLRP